jgi:hypothetical protein
VFVKLRYVGWVCALCGAVLLHAGVSLCGGLLVVGESDSVGSGVRMQVVLPYSMCCTFACSFAPSVSMLVFRCWSFGPCLCVCMVRDKNQK